MLTTELKRKLAVKSLKTDVLRRQASHQDIPVTYQFCQINVLICAIYCVSGSAIENCSALLYPTDGSILHFG